MKETLLTLLLAAFLSCSNPFSSEKEEDLNYVKNNEWRTSENIAIVKKRMSKAKEELHTLEDVRELQRQFEYKDYDKEWITTIETLFYYDLYDQCDGAAVLGKWSLEQIGIPARIAELVYKPKDPNKRIFHSICMSDDNHIFITNKYVCEIFGDNWIEAVFTFPLFDREYEALHDEERTYYREHYVNKIQRNPWEEIEGIWRYNMK